MALGLSACLLLPTHLCDALLLFSRRRFLTWCTNLRTICVERIRRLGVGHGTHWVAVVDEKSRSFVLISTLLSYQPGVYRTTAP